MSSGVGGQIAFTRTSSLFAVVTDAGSFSRGWSNFVSETIEHKIEELMEASITGYRDEPPSHKGGEMSDGDIVFEPNPNALGHLFRGNFGTHVSSIITEAGSVGANATVYSASPVVFHQFTPRQSALDERTFLDPYTLMVYRDVGSAFFYHGVVFPRLELNIQAGQLVGATIGTMGRSVSRAARSTVASLVSSGGRPWTWDMASIQISSGQLGAANLLADTSFEQMTVTFETPIEGTYLLDGTKQYGEMQANGFRSVRLTGTKSFRDQQAYDDFIAYENRTARVTLRHVASSQILGNPASAQYFTLQIDIPQLKYTRWSAPINGPNRLTATFDARAEIDVSAGYSARVQMTNTTSSY